MGKIPSIKFKDIPKNLDDLAYLNLKERIGEESKALAVKIVRKGLINYLPEAEQIKVMSEHITDVVETFDLNPGRLSINFPIQAKQVAIVGAGHTGRLADIIRKTNIRPTITPGGTDYADALGFAMLGFDFGKSKITTVSPEQHRKDITLEGIEEAARHMDFIGKYGSKVPPLKTQNEEQAEVVINALPEFFRSNWKGVKKPRKVFRKMYKRMTKYDACDTDYTRKIKPKKYRIKLTQVTKFYYFLALHKLAKEERICYYGYGLTEKGRELRKLICKKPVLSFDLETRGLVTEFLPENESTGFNNWLVPEVFKDAMRLGLRRTPHFYGNYDLGLSNVARNESGIITGGDLVGVSFVPQYPRHKNITSWGLEYCKNTGQCYDLIRRMTSLVVNDGYEERVILTIIRDLPQGLAGNFPRLFYDALETKLFNLKNIDLD